MHAGPLMSVSVGPQVPASPPALGRRGKKTVPTARLHPLVGTLAVGGFGAPLKCGEVGALSRLLGSRAGRPGLDNSPKKRAEREPVARASCTLRSAP